MPQHPTDDANPARDDSLRVYQRAPVARDEHCEGTWTRVVEQQTAKIPSAVFLVAAFGAMTASAVLELTGHPRWSRFVGMWAPTLLITGVYNKLVKAVGNH